MKRRSANAFLAIAAIARPFAVRAQQPLTHVVGFLHPSSPEIATGDVALFRKGLSESGFVEGRNVAIEYRWARGRDDQLPALAADLVARRVAVIAAISTPPAMAAKEATSTLPIVFTTAADPVAVGLVTSLNRPGGNLTGVATLNLKLGPKRLELLRELIPTATAIAVLVNPTNLTAEAQSRELQGAARTFGLELHIVRATSERDFDAVFASLPKRGVNALVISTDVLFINRSEQLAALAIRHGVPTITNYREFAAAGGLMSYGGSLADLYRTVGDYIGRILRGEKPGDLPVQQFAKVGLVINLRTARAFGLTVPRAMLLRADELIQ